MCSEGQKNNIDENTDKGIEAMFFAYRGFTSDPDRILSEKSYGRAHHRALYFIARNPGTTVSHLLNILGVTKQSLNRVLRTLIDDGFVENKIGTKDKRERLLSVTASGAQFEKELAKVQVARMRAAYEQAGPDAVQGFRAVLEAMMNPDMRKIYKKLGQDTE